MVVVGPPSGRSEPDKGGGRLVAVVSFSHAVQHVYSAILPLTYPFVVVEFHVSYVLLGLMLSIAGITGGLLQGAVGFYSRVPARWLLSLQNVLLAAATVAGAIAPGFNAFGAARCVGSIVSSPQHPVGSEILSRRFPQRRSTVLSWHVAGGSMGTVMVPMVASLAFVHLGWRMTLALFALPVLLGAVLVAVFLQDRPPVRPPGQASLSRSMLRRGTLMVLIASTVAAGGRGLGVLNAYVPIYLRNGLGLPTVTVGLVFTILLLGSVVGPVLAGAVADRVGARRIIVVCYLVGGAAVAVFASVGANLMALLAAAVAVGLFAYAESPLLQSLFAASIGGVGRSAYGLFFAIAYGLGSLWAVVIGTLVDRFGFSAGFYMMAGSFGIAAAVLVLDSLMSKAWPQAAA